MPRAALNDTNILIDFYEIGLLAKLPMLDLDMHTTDFVVEEVVVKAQLDLMHQLIEQEHLIVNSFTGEELLAIFEKEGQYPGLSLTDCSAWYWAEQNDGILLTGDGQLRRTAKKDGVEVHGSIWLLDELVNQEVLSKPEACSAIQRLQEKNRRLPQRECWKREQLWC